MTPFDNSQQLQEIQHLLLPVCIQCGTRDVFHQPVYCLCPTLKRVKDGRSDTAAAGSLQVLYDPAHVFLDLKEIKS